MAFRIISTSTLLLAVAVQESQGSASYFATDADPFLGQVVASRACIISDIETALQNSSMKDGQDDDGFEADLQKVADRLRPIFHALPKNRYDRLSSAGVRYLLHRHFLHHYAWLVRGLAPEGRGWNESFPLETLSAWAPDGLQTVIADHLSGRGLTLQECAVLATMLQNQVHAEALRLFRAVWSVHGLQLESKIDSVDMKTIIEDVMLVYVGGDTKIDITLESLDVARKFAEEVFPSWPRVQQFLLDIQVAVAWSVTAEGFSFVTGEQIMMRAMQQYGARQGNNECRTFKQSLLAMESPSRPGRVELTRFHASAMNEGHLEFAETAAYLRQLGVLDESVPGQQEVIIPNYLYSPANSAIAGDFFAVGCIDECEDLLSHIERRVGGPTATPEQLADLVRSLPSLQSEQVVISDTLMQQLRQVAALHGGRVPLHGRLFALWMHHAYPRDCQHPARAGTTKQTFPEDYEVSTGLFSTESDDELKEDAKRFAASAPTATIVVPLSWDLEEELLQEPLPDDSIFRLGVVFAGIAATFSAGMAASRLQPQGTSVSSKRVV